MTADPRATRPRRSIIVTTYGGETAHTQHCLGRIRRWKTPQDEVIVVVHDETPTLRQFVELCRTLRIVDRLVLAKSGHGHVRGVNLGFALAKADIVFNVCIDMRVGGALMSECTELLRSQPNVGLVGWHYDWSADMEGSRWRDGRLQFSLRKIDSTAVAGRLPPEDIENVRTAAWYTGRVFESVGEVRFACVNGSFFGMHRRLWQRLGGFDERRYPVHFADDFLTYAILDQGLDVLNVPRRFRCGAEPDELLALTDLRWQKRVDPYAGIDRVEWTVADPEARLTERENVYLDMLARTLDARTVVSIAGGVPSVSTVSRAARTRRYDDVCEVPQSDVILCSGDAPRADLAECLRPGGVLVAFDAAGSGAVAANEQALDTLRIIRRDPVRVAFERSAAGDVKGVG